MFETFFLYFFILILLLFGSWLDKSSEHLTGWFAILIVSIILGFRYNVGIDYPTYLDIYNSFLFFGKGIGTSKEIGYDFLNYFCAYWGLHPGIFFSLTVFIQFFLIYLALRKNCKVLLYAMFFYVTTGQMFGALNIIRQALAFSFFLYSCKYIKERKIQKYLIIVSVAISIHTSAIILIPVYWIPCIWNKYFRNAQSILLLLIYLCTIVLAPQLFSLFLTVFQEILSNTVYFNYVPNLGDRLMRVNSGVGLILFSIIDCIIIFYNKETLMKFPEYNHLFPIFYIGIILSKIFGIDMLLSRIPYYFVSLRFVMLSVLTLYLIQTMNIKRQSLLLVIMSVFMAVFIADIINGSSGCAPFKFIDI